MSDILSRTYNNGEWRSLPLTAKFERVVNEWIRLECDPRRPEEEKTHVTFGVTHWWYSPSKDFFWHRFPYELKHPYLNVRDWIYMARTVDGQIDWLEHGSYDPEVYRDSLPEIEEDYTNEVINARAQYNRG